MLKKKNVTNMKKLKGISRMGTISLNGFLSLLFTSTTLATVRHGSNTDVQKK